MISNPPENCINIENNPVFKKREQAEIQGLNQGSSSANKVSNNSRYEFAMTLSEFSPDKTRKGAHGWAQPHDHMLVKGVGNQTLGDEGEKYTSLFCTSNMKSFFQSHTMKFNKNMQDTFRTSKINQGFKNAKDAKFQYMENCQRLKSETDNKANRGMHRKTQSTQYTSSTNQEMKN